MYCTVTEPLSLRCREWRTVFRYLFFQFHFFNNFTCRFNHDTKCVLTMKGHRPRTRAQLKHRNRFRCQYSMCQTVQAISVGPFVCVCRIHIHLLWFTCAAMDSLANGVAKSPTCHTVYPLEQPRAMEELWLFADRFVCFYSSKFFRWIRTRRYLIYNAYVWCVYAWVVVLFCFFCWPKSIHCNLVRSNFLDNKKVERK